MAQHGGYRKPAHPAPVSGPGSQSRRTDGGPSDRQAMRDIPNAAYGEQKAMGEIQSGAPMAAAPAMPQAVPMGAPTQRPDEPVTAGNPLGAGVGPEAAGVDTRSIPQQDAAALKDFMPLLSFMAGLPDATPSTRSLLRRLRGASG